jgi:hypothetical protein
MTLFSWQKRRSEFNHDWLKNKYIPKLGAWVNLLDERIEDKDLERSYVSSILPGWEHQQKEALALPRDFETEMSPRTLFREPPLSNCDDDTKQWLGELVHHLWLIRYSVGKLVSDALESTEKANDAYSKLKSALKGCTDTSNVEALKPFRPFFVEFLRSCRALSEAIEKFSSEVKVV